MATKCVEDLITKEEELMDFAKEKYSRDMLEYMDENSLKLYKTALELVSLANEVLREQSDMISLINRKIDTLANGRRIES